MKKHWKKITGLLLAASLALAGCGTKDTSTADEPATQDQAQASAETGTGEEEKEGLDLQILATSDLHGKFVSWDYALNEESTSGSMAQLATAVKELRDDNTILVDAGDTIQDNAADMFLEEETHPMILAMNEIGYDVWVTGNHEYNYGMDVLKRIIGQQKAKVLTGNVYSPDDEPLADGYTIIEKGGAKVGIIGMVTPNITKWDSVNLKDWNVTDPVEETAKIIEEIKDDVDVLIAVEHMDMSNEYEVPDSGATDLANACPDLDLIVAAHGHQLIPGEEVNGVLVVENKNSAASLMEIHLQLEKSGDAKWEVADRTAEAHDMQEYAADEELAAALEDYNKKAKDEASVVIGKLINGDLSPENEIKEIPTAQLEDTALIDLINEVQTHYTDADISAAALFIMDANLKEGDIKKSDTSLIYKYSNTLYKLQMTGTQLKKYMEWTAAYFNTWKPGDLTISFNSEMRAYNYDMFSGINYEIDISKEPGSRILNLTWPDGKPVADDDEFVIAVNNYRANSHLLSPGEIFEEGEELPVLLDMDVKGDIGGVRELIRDYIINVKDGVIEPNVDYNWKLIGNAWDEALHQKVVEMAANGEIAIPASEDGRTPNVTSITEADIK